jgi:predicted dehydrogenase
MTKILRTAVIGVGEMGQHHARVYAEAERCQLVGVYDADPARAGAIASCYGCGPFRTLEELFGAGLDAVSIAVPTTSHAAIAIQALERGLHVLVEKPLAATLDEALAVMRAAEASRRKLMVGHIERFNPAVQAIKAAVQPGAIISINIIRVGPLPPRIKDAGVVKDLAVHDIDLVRFLTESDVEAVHAVTSSTLARHEDSASILLRTAGGVGAQLTTNWITPFKSREIQVITADKLIKADLLTQQVKAFSRFSGHDQSYIVRDLKVRQREPLRSQLEAFLGAVAGDGPVPIGGDDGLKALAVAIQASGLGAAAFDAGRMLPEAA